MNFTLTAVHNSNNEVQSEIDTLHKKSEQNHIQLLYSLGKMIDGNAYFNFHYISIYGSSRLDLSLLGPMY